MEPSILKSTKAVLGIADEYTAFDLDILTHINSAFSILDELIDGPEGGFTVEDSAATWEQLGLSQKQLNMVRTYIYLKVRLLFDPPGTSYLINAMEEQVKEHEYRLNTIREREVYPLEEEEVSP